jgi:uncharacterized phiE125 gp8 family phage protein
MEWHVVTPPTALPITYPQVVEHLSLDQSDDATYVQETINDAFDDLQAETATSLMPCTIQATYFDFNTRLFLPRGPVKAITSVTGNGNTISPTLYKLQRAGNTDYLYFPTSAPTPIVIIYTAGYSNIQSDIAAGYPILPNDLRRALYMTVANMYLNREAQGATNVKDDNAYMRIINRNRRTKVVG